MNAQRTIRRTVLILCLLAVAGTAGFLLGRFTVNNTSETGQILYWQAPMDPTEIYDEPGKSKMGMDLIPVYADETAPASAEGTVLYWQAPMDPTEIYDEPGKSKMGMDLIPVYADEAGRGVGGTVSIDPVTVQNMGVRTATVQQMEFSRTIRTVGQVEYNEESLYIVNTKISGWIEKLYVNYEGESIQKGAPLLEIYSPELVATQEEYLLALKNRDLVASSSSSSVIDDANRLVASARKRLEYWDIPPAEIIRLEQTGETKRTIVLPAPASGIVIHKNAVEGAYITAGMDLYRIADLSSVWVHASIYDYELPWIVEGQRAVMNLSYLPEKEYTGHVSYIYPYLRDKARDVHVRLVFINPSLDLKPGMYVNVMLQGKVLPQTTAIPSEAVIRSGERTIVFVVRGTGKFEPREIRIGEEGGPNNGYVRVLGGLLGGEQIVTSAQFMLDSESRLQEAIQKMLQERSQSTTQPEVNQSETIEEEVVIPGEALSDRESDKPAEHQH